MRPGALVPTSRGVQDRFQPSKSASFSMFRTILSIWILNTDAFCPFDVSMVNIVILMFYWGQADLGHGACHVRKAGHTSSKSLDPWVKSFSSVCAPVVFLCFVFKCFRLIVRSFTSTKLPHRDGRSFWSKHTRHDLYLIPQSRYRLRDKHQQTNKQSHDRGYSPQENEPSLGFNFSRSYLENLAHNEWVGTAQVVLNKIKI